MDVEVGSSGPGLLSRGANPVGKKGGRWRNFILAYKTLGVVFGGLVTSPLYVYPSMNLKSPSEDDYLGIYSIMFWTLTLIGVVKYVCIALHADDNGEENSVKIIQHISNGGASTSIDPYSINHDAIVEENVDSQDAIVDDVSTEGYRPRFLFDNILTELCGLIYVSTLMYAPSKTFGRCI